MLIFLSGLLRRTSGPNSVTLPDPVKTSIRAALERGGELVYTRGLLRKGVGLCHGVAGSVFALLSLHIVDMGGKMYWFVRALHLAHLATEYEALTQAGEMCVPDRKYSLYEGAAGMCCAWAEVLARLEGAKVDSRQVGMPGYDDLL